MDFTKMQGLGNDYIYINCFKENVENPSELSIKMSDRHFGVGSDGLVLIMKSDSCDFKMRMFNADGSEAEMCGNAIRCIGKYVFDNKMTQKDVITIETLGGVKTLHLSIENNLVTKVTADMGEPILQPDKIPVKINKNLVISYPIIIEEKEYSITCVSMGNPHAVIFTDDVEKIKLSEIGPKFEHCELFPKRINTEFVKIVDRHNLIMRVWERGSGETLACGTGASAVLVAGVLNNLCERKASIKLLGGVLEVQWNKDDNHVYNTGPAVKVFEGIW